MLADHHAESFDMHFEHTKKERHDRMMARLQLQEKQNQPQSASGQTTIAYASGQDVLKKVIGNANEKDRRDKFSAQNAHDKLSQEEDKDENMEDSADHPGEAQLLGQA